MRARNRGVEQLAQAGQSSTYVAFVLSIQQPIPPGRICSIQPIRSCLLHPALPVHRSYPILNLESSLCRHLSHWLLKVLADERHPQNAPLSFLPISKVYLMGLFLERCFHMMQYLGLLDLLSRPSLIAFIFQALSLPCLLRCVNPPICTFFLAQRADVVLGRRELRLQIRFIAICSPATLVLKRLSQPRVIPHYQKRWRQVSLVSPLPKATFTSLP